MKKWLKKISGLDRLERDLENTKSLLETTQKKLSDYEEKIAKAGHDPKAEATDNHEPYITINSIELDKENSSYGSVELDWNKYFIKQLREQGYPGKTDEDVVDLWFQNVCRNIVLETLQQEESAIDTDNIRYINRRDIGNGKTEVS